MFRFGCGAWRVAVMTIGDLPIVVPCRRAGTWGLDAQEKTLRSRCTQTSLTMPSNKPNSKPEGVAISSTIRC
jgi:hypothetical protein